MPDKDAQLAKSVDTLVRQAAEVLDLAKGQRVAADKQLTAANVLHYAAGMQENAAHRQHENAHKLETVGEALQDDVAAIKEKLIDTARPQEKEVTP